VNTPPEGGKRVYSGPSKQGTSAMNGIEWKHVTNIFAGTKIEKEFKSLIRPIRKKGFQFFIILLREKYFSIVNATRPHPQI